MKAGAMSNPIITVVRDPQHPLGKHFTLNSDGKVSKKAAVNVSFATAVMHRVETHTEFATLLATVGNDPHAAIINASFNGIEVGDEFLILSEREIEKRLGIPASDRARQSGVHLIEYDGKTMKAVGRFKDNARSSIWQLLDRDIDSHTPAKFSSLEISEWIGALEPILPGIGKTSYVLTPSTSSRVMLDGKPVGSGNGHVWIKVDNPADVERVRSAMIVLAAQAEMTWKKPRLSKKEKGTVVGYSLTTIVDPSVWTHGRLVFDGAPTVGEGLTVEPLSAIIHQGACDALATSTIVLPDARSIREITRRAGVEMSVTAGSNGLRIVANDLTLATEIETKEHGILTVREIIALGITGKLRCQTPFRDSDSWAAFFNRNADGVPFVYDSGTNITHWLNEFEAEEVKIIPAAAVVKELIPKVITDSGAVLEDDAVNALATLQQHKPADYQRARNALKQANKEVSLATMDRAVKTRVSEKESAQTHHGYAKVLLAELTEGAWKPVGHQGALYVLSPDTCIWERKPVEALIRSVAEAHDGKDNCERSSDYRAIAEHATSLANDDSYFAEGPTGLACPGGFYQIADNKIVLVPLTPDHRQRVMLPYNPEAQPIPEFKRFLHETFASDHEGEEQQQITLMQEIAGGIMLGIIYKYQVAILFYEPFGRAGKGTIEKQFRALVPKEFVSAISPFKWNHDYHVATLAGKRLNVVGELPENEPIPAAAFKSVLGGDLITGRHPTHRPITFTNEATHLFMSNHLITTKDQSEAFFARWKIIEFPNSRLRLGLPLDENLAQRIIDNELPGIAYWALQGAARLLKNGKFSVSTAHDRLMAKWRRTTNTLEEFIHEDCDLLQEGTYKRSELYSDYVEWCSENGRKPFSKGRVRELLEHNVGMGIRLVEVNGHETFRGLQMKPAKPIGSTPKPTIPMQKRKAPTSKWITPTPKPVAQMLTAEDITDIDAPI
jgi:P4 family phage/plasmid primase-like protien